MSNDNFSPKAAVLWAAIPKEARGRILKNVFCVRCRAAVEIINFHGEEENGNLILTGKCAKCDHEVARFIETSEVSLEGN
jgi:hypothetical protein